MTDHQPPAALQVHSTIPGEIRDAVIDSVHAYRDALLSRGAAAPGPYVGDTLAIADFDDPDGQTFLTSASLPLALQACADGLLVAILPSVLLTLLNMHNHHPGGRP